jgi:hypothetical protein
MNYTDRSGHEIVFAAELTALDSSDGFLAMQKISSSGEARVPGAMSGAQEPATTDATAIAMKYDGKTRGAHPKGSNDE